MNGKGVQLIGCAPLSRHTGTESRPRGHFAAVRYCTGMKKQNTINGIPVYKASIEGEEGMLKVSLVDYPAVITGFEAFAEEQPVKFAVEDEEQRLILGPVMRADFPIYRFSKQRGAYYLIFDAETIRDMAEKYLADGNCNKVNLQHEDGSDVEGVHMTQYFFKDSAKGIAPAGFDKVEEGSLFAEFHVENDEVWQGVKDGTFKGFSLEGMFALVPDTAAVPESANLMAEAMAAIDEIPNKTDKHMTLIERMKAALGAMVAAQEETPAAEVEKFGRIATEKGTLIWAGDDDIAVGVEVWSEDEDSNRVEVESGDYPTDEGKIIVIESGKVSEIKEQPAEEEPAEPTEGEKMAAAIKEKFAAIRQAFSYALDQLWSNVYAAIDIARGNMDYYIAELGNDYAIIEGYGVDGFYKYTFEVAEDGAVTLTGEPVKVAHVWVEEGEQKQEGDQPAESEEMAALRAQVADLQAKLAAQPAAPSAHDTFKQQGKGETFLDVFKSCRK